MENTEAQHTWEQQQDDVNDSDNELEVSLIGRKKNPNQTLISTTNNGEDQEHEDEEFKDFSQQVDEDEKEKEKQHASEEYCVYFDNNKGNGNGVHSVMSNQNGVHQKHGNFPQISVEEIDKCSSSFINNKTEISDIEVIKDEITEFDVETVLKKQDTHDLYCPNCNSCITKRVILRKRKRKIPVPGEDSKRNKLETRVHSDNNQGLNGVDPSLDDDVQPRTSNENDDHREEPAVFRCLSCFSIFIPTAGNGFKLFRMFGNKRNEENNEHSQKEVYVKKHWFSNIFASDKVEQLNHQGTIESLDSQNNSARISVSSSNLNDPNVLASSRQEANSHTTNGTTYLEKDEVKSATPSVDTDENAPFVTQRSDTTEQRVAKESDNTTRESKGRITMDSQVSDTHEQLLTSYHVESNGESDDYPGMFVVKPPFNHVEPEENSVSPLQHDGLKLFVPPNVGSLIIDNSQMNQELDVTVQTNNPGKDTIINVESKHLDASGLQRSPPHTLGATETPGLQYVESGSYVAEQGGDTTETGGRSLDVVKSVVYGGLIESITSLSVVSSAAGAGAATLNVLALGLANIFGGLFVISHDLWDLKNECTRGGSSNEQEDRYQQLLGRRADFPLHMVVSLLSYLVFGFLPPLVYGFTFRESDDKDLKLLMVAAASIVCIITLAAGKAYVQTPHKSYFKTISYYVMFGFMVSGASYLFGELIIKLLEKIDIFHSGLVENLSIYGTSSNPVLVTS